MQMRQVEVNRILGKFDGMNQQADTMNVAYYAG